jgi:hypothetical protein
VGTRGGGRRTGWREGEVWFDADDVQWFGEVARSVRTAALPQPLLAGIGGGAVALPAPGVRPLPWAKPRPARRPQPGPSRRRRLATRLLPVVTGVAAAAVASATLILPEATERLLTSPPATVLGARDLAAPATIPDPRAAAPPASAPAAAEAPAAQTRADRPEYPAIAWRHSRAVGVPHGGQLVAGVALPRRGPDWVTWDPVRDRVPNRANRLYGTDALVRMLLDVIADYRAAHPAAPKVVVGDLSRSGGGDIDEHVSHENGLDVDVYYPRRDGKLRPPALAAQVDRRLAQDLLDRFVAAGAQVVFVGYSTPFRGSRDVVVPYPNHDNHMHVRIPARLASR